MPFPGSQQNETVQLAYFLHHNIIGLRILLVLVAIVPIRRLFTQGLFREKIIVGLLIAVYAGIFYLFNYRFLADKMFYQPEVKTFTKSGNDSSQLQKLVIGVLINGDAKAYPVEIIGYHHQVQDTLGGRPILVTYCTVCRTGRVYSPVVKGHVEQFRLVGMDHFNAMLEDKTTGSWWQQATGIAITGPLTGQRLKELPSAQMTLQDWEILHPQTTVLQQDPHFKAKYDSLKGFDEGTLSSSLEKRDTASWKKKSWVVGVKIDHLSKAYDWNTLISRHLIEDELNGIPLLITVDSTGKSFFVLCRKTEQQILHFTYDPVHTMLTDTETHSNWLANGHCIAGYYKGTVLQAIQSYQEFWHSWQHFHPETAVYPEQ